MAQKKKEPAKKAPAKKPVKKAPAKKASVKKAAPDYSAMTLEELAIEWGMSPGLVKEDLAGLIMLGDTEEGIREHLLKKIAERDAKEAAKAEAERKIADGIKRNCGKALQTVTVPLPRKGVDLVMKELPSGLFMGVFPVTNRQWWAVLGGARPRKADADLPHTDCPRDYCPFEDQGEDAFREYYGEEEWEDAWRIQMEVGHDGTCERFLKALNELDAVKRSGLLFRLPTAEEWEYACRAGSKGDYCLREDGVEITEENLDTVSWGDGEWNGTSEDLPPVGRKRANAFGLHDMLGLVGEWTASNCGYKGIYCGGRRAKASSRERQPAYECNLKCFVSAMDDLGFRLCADRRSD
jgi:hypothetical protein